jgi:hypothetical protein
MYNRLEMEVTRIAEEIHMAVSRHSSQSAAAVPDILPTGT